MPVLGDFCQLYVPSKSTHILLNRPYLADRSVQQVKAKAVLVLYLFDKLI